MVQTRQFLHVLGRVASALVMSTVACVDTTFEETAGVSKSDGYEPVLKTRAETSTLLWQIEHGWTDKVPANHPLIEPLHVVGMLGQFNYEQLYSLWVQSFLVEPLDAGLPNGAQTFSFLFPSPKGPLERFRFDKLDCADLAYMLRFLFAIWNGLPQTFSNGNAVFGPFGRVSGGNTHDYASNGATDIQDVNYGAFFAELLSGVVKDEDRRGRLARLLVDAANKLYTGNLTTRSGNTIDVDIESIMPGDIGLSFDAKGSGHARVIARKIDQPDGSFELNIAQSTNPPEVPAWVGSAGSWSELFSILDETSLNGGGGLKRFVRTVVDCNDDFCSWKAEAPGGLLPSTPLSELLDDPQRLSRIVSPGGKDSIIDYIQLQRQRLRANPSSCRSRERREKGFAMLYDALKLSNLSPHDADADYRKIDDYVFPLLVYEKSPSCAWLPDDGEVIFGNVWTALQKKMQHRYDSRQDPCANAVPAFVLTARDAKGNYTYGDFPEVRWGSGGSREPWLEKLQSPPKHDVVAPRSPALTFEAWCRLQVRQGKYAAIAVVPEEVDL